jgi:hydrogenase maturation protease
MASNKWREASVSPTSKGDGQGPRGDERHSLPATLVIGLGNFLRGDDGVGVRVAQILAAQALPDDVEVVDGGTQGLGIVNLMEGRQRVILVDAADVGIDSGEFVRFTLDEARLLGDDRHLSVHAAGLRDALALEVLPDEVVIFGVQPANLEWDSTLSPQVEAALPSLVAAVWAEVAVSDQWPMLGISPQADC